MISLVFVNSLTWNVNSVNTKPSTLWLHFSPHYSVLQLSAKSKVITQPRSSRRRKVQRTPTTPALTVRHLSKSFQPLIKQHLSKMFFFLHLIVHTKSFEKREVLLKSRRLENNTWECVLKKHWGAEINGQTLKWNSLFLFGQKLLDFVSLKG